MEIKFSVLMAVHYGENPEALSLCLESIGRQDLPSDEIILVIDGIITDPLECIISRWKKVSGERLKLIRLERNMGFARALNEGLRHCSFDWVARMDTNDIAMPERFARQINFLGKNPQYDVVGSWIEEYDQGIANRTGYRKVPRNHEEIIRFADWRSPVNHMSVFFRKKAVINSGGYPEELIKMQDYGLWAKLILGGSLFYNLQEPLVRVRAGHSLLKRRGGWRYCLHELKLLNYLRDIGFFSFWQFTANLLIRLPVRIAPPAVRKLVYDLLRAGKGIVCE